MRKFVSGFIICLFSLSALAAESDSSVVFKASFLKHEVQSYEISRTLYSLQKKDTTSYERIGFHADVYVKDSTEDYYVLLWRFSKFSINTDDRQLKQLIELAKPVEISCRISKPGVLMEFLDGEKVSTCLEEALPQVLAPFSNQQGSVARAQVAHIYDMRETIETLMLRSVNLFLQVYGLGYTLGEIVDVPVEVNSQFSSKPIKGITRKKLTKIDTENHLAVLSSATFLDNDALKSAIKEYLHLDSIPQEYLNQENMGSVVMDLTTSWPLWIFEQRETRTGNNKYGELVEIQYIPYEKPSVK